MNRVRVLWNAGPLAVVLALAACGGAAPAPTGAPVAVAADSAAPSVPGAVPSAPVVPAAKGWPIGTGAFGTAGPTILRDVDEQERWMALCQARKDTDGDGKIEVHYGQHGDTYGDDMEQFLVLGGGEGTRIDYFLGKSEDGRWVAVIRGSELQLVDTTTGAIAVMADADLESDGRPGMRHRAAVFAGQQLVFVRTADNANDRLVVRDLATGTETERPVTGRAWRFFPEGARQMAVYTVGLGEKFPQLRTSLAGGECLGQPMSYGTYGQDGPAPVQRWLDLTTGAETTSDGTSVAVGDELLYTPASGGIFLGRAQIAPSTCQAMIMAVLENPARVVAQCTERKQQTIWLFGRDLARKLETVKGDGVYSDYTNMLKPGTGVVCDAGLFCIDVRTSARIDLKGGVATYVFGNWVYVVHATMSSRTFEVIDVATGRRTKLRSTDSQQAAGKYVLDSDGNLIDLEQASIAGTLGTLSAARVVSLSAKGRVLVAVNNEAEGPYQWTSL